MSSIDYAVAVADNVTVALKQIKEVGTMIMSTIMRFRLAVRAQGT